MSRGSQPNVRVAVLADDLTGAGDTLAQFADHGWPAYLQRSATVPDLPTVSVVGRALLTRSLPDPEAEVITEKATRAVLDAGVNRVYLKVDSTMRGSVSAQLSGALCAWREVHAKAFVVLCPAYPAMGRTVEAGRLLVDGKPVSESAAATDPVTPVRVSALEELVPGSVVVPVAEESAWEAALVQAGAVHDVVVAEASTDGDLATLARVIARLAGRALPAGSAGLAAQLAKAWRLGHRERTPATRPITGPIVLVRTSANDTSKRQVERASAYVGKPLWRWRTGVSLNSGNVDAAADAVAAGCWLLVLEPPDERLPDADAAKRVAHVLAATAARLAAAVSADAVILVGGDGAEATLDALGVPTLTVLRTLVEGVPLSETIGIESPLYVITKAGGFGADDTLITVIRRLRHE